MMVLKPKNWERFQHYKDRSPPWVKLHKSLLDDRVFMRLPIASKALAPLLWLLASESKDGAFDASFDELEFRLRVSHSDLEKGIKPLIDNGFFVVASGLLADCLHVAVPETETETETEKKDSPAKQDFAADARTLDNCPHQRIIDLYHEHLPTAIRVREWTPSRAQALRTRWREKPQRQNLEWWERFFVYISESDFLMGRTQSVGRKPFEIDLEWICQSKNFVKVIEGKFHEAK